MTFFPDPNIGFDYCLSCAGTGRRGGCLSGKKKCKKCNGSGKREVEVKFLRPHTPLDGDFRKDKKEDE